MEGSSLQFDEPQTYELFVEVVEMAEIKKFLEAVGMMFVRYYLFKISFPLQLEITLAFFTTFIFKINYSTIKDK